MSVAGEWAGFDLDWLETEILRAEHRRWFSWLPHVATMKAVRHDWERIRSLLTEGRTA